MRGVARLASCDVELLGATLAVLGTRLVVASAGVVRGERTSWARAVGAGVTLLAINGALAPIQGFAVALCIFVGIGMIALLAVRARSAPDRGVH